MKNGTYLFLGLFAALAASWAGVVLGAHLQLGRLTPYYDEGEGSAFPQPMPGIAAQGARVYADLGCASCHTRQVRRPSFGADQARGWGDRQSVARDYIFQARPQIGSSRFGPDLTNLAARTPAAPTAAELARLFYTGSPTHPAYPFLFETRPIVGERSVRALDLAGTATPRPGYQVLPDRRGEALIAYLLNLNQGFEYPEARPVPSEAGAEAPRAPAAAVAPGAPARPAAADPAPPSGTGTSSPQDKRLEQAVPPATPDEKQKIEPQKQ